jgi:leucyl-tRNA synthetase
MTRYNPTEIEPKWQKIWADDARYQAQDNDTERQKFYISCMFPYPSGAGMHTGHAFEHVIVDAKARFERAHGRNVLNPMGWDAFGLPAENYAIKTGTPPAEVTKTNISNFIHQLKSLGFSIDWSREINTSDPSYYKWTQWIFTQLFQRGLAYQKEANQWWCPVDKTVLANEQVEAGKCWRCGTEVEKKAMKQWFFKITDYADALLAELPDLDWPEKIKTAQKNWIGKSEGAEIQFAIARDDTKRVTTSGAAPASDKISDFSEEGADSSTGPASSDLRSEAAGREYDGSGGQTSHLTVFTTRPDTIFGATFLVIAPEHPLVKTLTNDETKETVDAYVAHALKKSEIERMSDGKEKTGVFTGSHAINPATGERIPIWVADYVLGGYGTGAIMAVPAHDERDLAFAEKYKLPVTQVISKYEIRKGDRAPRDDWLTREKEVVDAIITDGNGNYLLQIESNEDGTEDTHFVGGGVEKDDESVEAAIRREVLEEVGYANILSITQAAPYDAAFAQRKLKKRNHKTWGAFYEVVVDRTVQVKSEIDDGLHAVAWVPKGEVAQRISWPHHAEAWRYYLAGTSIDTEVREGVLVNSGIFDGMRSEEAREEIVAWLEQQGVGKAKTTYKMRDWLVSRQRYWGAPIPIVHTKDHGAIAVAKSCLPVELPYVKDYAPTGKGSVLASVPDWVNVWVNVKTGETAAYSKPKPDGDDWVAGERETDTMDGYACSSWYLLRYTDPHDDQQPWAPEKVNYWAPLDMYVGGDHAVAHLLYVRFWTHVFHDMGLTDFKEPVKRLVYHGYINAEDGTKMSKSKGNVVDPLEVIDQGYGADALRTFELFLGPINENSNWSSRGIAGVYRFLNRVWTLEQEFMEFAEADEADSPSRSASSRTASHRESNRASAPVASRAADVAQVSQDEMANLSSTLTTLRHRTVKKVTDDIRRLSFNTAIAALMEYVNELYKLKEAGFTSAWREPLETLVQLIAPFAPHMAAELWQQLGRGDMLDTAPWPTWDDALLVSETITLIVQVNGKLRAKLDVPKDISQVEAENLALADAHVQTFLGNKKPAKVVYIPGRLVNIVV